MRKIKFLSALVVIALFFASCDNSSTKTTLIDFEDVTLGSTGISTTSSFQTGGFTFTGDPIQFWNGGIICSSQNDTVTAGYLNQYSCIAGMGAAQSVKFGVLYYPAYIKCPTNVNGDYTFKSIMVNNSTYAYLDMKNGNAPYSKKFVSGDWFKLNIKGFYSKVETANVDVYLADFRDGKSFIMKEWKKVDVSSLGKVDSVSFSFTSSDNGDYGMNTPAYVCLDNIEFTQKVTEDK